MNLTKNFSAVVASNNLSGGDNFRNANTKPAFSLSFQESKGNFNKSRGEARV